MSRDDLLQEQYEHRRRRSPTRSSSARPNAILIIVSNPLDAMCHVALDAPASRASASSAGRRARLGPLPHLHRDGAGRLGRGRHRLRARRPRRHDGAAAALLDRRRHPDHRAALADRIDAIVQAHARTAAREIVQPAQDTAPPTTRRLRRSPRWSTRSCSTRTRSCRAASYLQGEYGINGSLRRRAGQARRGRAESR